MRAAAGASAFDASLPRCMSDADHRAPGALREIYYNPRGPGRGPLFGLSILYTGGTGMIFAFCNMTTAGIGDHWWAGRSVSNAIVR